MAVAEKNGHWYIVKSKPIIEDGKKRYKQDWIPISATCKEEAKKIEDSLKKKKKQGITIDPKMTVYDLSKIWMEQHVKSPVEPLAEPTQVFYQSRLDIYIIPVIGTIKILDLTVDDLDLVLFESANKVTAEGGKKDTTLASIYSTMSSMFGWAKKKRKIAENLMEFVDCPVVAEREYSLLSEENIPVFLESVLKPSKCDTKFAQDQRQTYYRMFLTELTTALRIDELCGMMVKDIDFKRKIYYVRSQVTSAGANPTFGPAKDREGQLPDRIPLADMVVDELKKEIKYNEIKKGEAEERGLIWKDYGLVFTNSTGGPIDSKNLSSRTFKKALEKAGLPDMKFHGLRHSVLTILANNNADPNAICNLARHKDYNFFKSRYLHPDVEAQRPAVETLEKLITSKTASSQK
jgi:integrase